MPRQVSNKSFTRFHLCPGLPSSIFPLCVRLEFVLYFSIIFANSLAVGYAICSTSVYQSTPQPILEPGTFRAQCAVSTWHCSAWRQFRFRSRCLLQHQSTLLKPYNVKNMNYVSLTAVIFFSPSSLPLSHPFINSTFVPLHIVTKYLSHGYKCLCTQR